MFARRLARTAFAAAGAAVVGFGIPAAAEAAEVDAPTDPDAGLFLVKQAVNPATYRDFVVTSVKAMADGTRVVRLSMPTRHGELGTSATSHLEAAAVLDGNGVTGKVTPISAVATKGFLELAASPTDPDPLAQAIANTKEGAVMLFKGPFKGFQVSRNQFESIGIVARGSSVTAALQVITTLLADPRDDTEIRLVYSAESPSRVMLRNHLDALALIHPRFKLSIVVDEADAAWDGPSGPVTKGLLASVLPPPTGAGSTAVLVAGPEPFQRAITGSPAAAGGPELSGTLGDMKYAADQVHSI